MRGPELRGPKARRGGVLAVALLVLSLAPAAAAGGIAVDLRFDGQPLEPTAPPDFTCFSVTANRWVACGVKRGEGPGAWVLEGLEPGRYRLHVSIDENPVNPRRFPGDYEAQQRFEVTERGRRAVLLLDRGLAGGPPRRRSLHPRWRGALVELPLPGPGRQPPARSALRRAGARADRAARLHVLQRDGQPLGELWGEAG